MSKIENALNKTPELVLNQASLNELLDEAWDMRGAAQPVVVNLRGAPGIGKTQLLIAWAKKMKEAYPDFHLHDVMTVDKTPIDFVAYIPNHETHTLEGYINASLAWATKPGAVGALFFDEVTQAMEDTKKVLSKITNERKIGDVPLSPDVIVVMAGNRPTDKAGASKLLSMLANRVDTYDCVPDTEAIVDYMIDMGYNPLIAAYMASSPYMEERDFQPNEASFYSHRSMERVAQKWTRRDSVGNKGVVMDLMSIAASIGIGRAREFLSFAQMIDKMPSKKEIRNDPQGCRVPTKLDEQCAVACMLSVNVDKSEFPQVAMYMQRFPISLQILFLKLVLKRGGDEMKKLKEFVQWVIKPEVKDAIMDRVQ